MKTKQQLTTDDEMVASSLGDIRSSSSSSPLPPHKIPRYILDEVNELSNISFRFEENRDPTSTTSSIGIICILYTMIVMYRLICNFTLLISGRNARLPARKGTETI